MRVGMFLNYAGGFREAADEVAELERAGVDLIAVPEAYSFDAVSQLGFLAARTSTITLAAGILQLYTRTPTLTAMTAAGLDYVSDGRFELGIGASGPQVIEGFHGVRYDAPLARTREIIEICRMTWRREPVVHQGSKYHIPLPEGEGTGLGKPLKLINHPVRERIPITVASLGQKSVEQTAEIADGWLPMFFHPERAGEVWGEALAAGAAKRSPDLGRLDVFASPALAITDHPETVLPAREAAPRALRRRHGRARQELLQRPHRELRLRGRGGAHPGPVPRRTARTRRSPPCPTSSCAAISLIGPASYVAERVEAFRAAGVTTLTVTPLARTPPSVSP